MELIVGGGFALLLRDSFVVAREGMSAFLKAGIFRRCGVTAAVLRSLLSLSASKLSSNQLSFGLVGDRSPVGHSGGSLSRDLEAAISKSQTERRHRRMVSLPRAAGVCGSRVDLSACACDSWGGMLFVVGLGSVGRCCTRVWGMHPSLSFSRRPVCVRSLSLLWSKLALLASISTV
ncbi:hypothetical protein IGI04_027589 [Brassica rapa subsp. trilocularis]|uniref:Secreted protein n=1 Tax=Brassica rapa subsp. trilocularis TaxID=1813537 RepID=A0ABQ7KZG4_BRACM|nr:hypothetical protein IGI04_027589 [Brassica rapa subsp. trilocularis]